MIKKILKVGQPGVWQSIPVAEPRSTGLRQAGFANFIFSKYAEKTDFLYYTPLSFATWKMTSPLESGENIR